MHMTYQMAAYAATTFAIVLAFWNYVLERNLKHVTASADQMAMLIEKIASGKASVALTERGVEIVEN